MKEETKVLIFALLVFVLGTVKTSVSLFQTDYANGWDSYFYLIQAKSLHESGAMHSPSASLIHPFIYVFTQGGFINGYKIGMSLLVGLIGLAGFYTGYKSSKRLAVATVVAAAIVFSPSLTFFSSQYPKNLLGIALFYLLLWLSVGKKYLVPGVLVLLNFFGHKLTFFISAFTVGSRILFEKVNSKSVMIIIGIALAAVISAALFPGLLSMADSERLNNMFNPSPGLPLLRFIDQLGSERVDVLWIVEMFITFGLVLYLIVKAIVFRSFRLRDPMMVLLFVFLLLNFPFLRWGEDGLAMRLFLVSQCIWPILLIPAFSDVIKDKIIWIFAVVFLIGGVFTYSSYDPLKHDPPYQIYDKITNRLQKTDGYKKSELIIAHKSLAEYITFATNKDVLPWLPEYEIHEDRLWRILTDIPRSDLEYFIKRKSKFTQLVPNYFLIRESDWQRVIKKIKKEDEELYDHLNTWRNPNRIRPAYLLKNKSKN